MRFRGSRIGFGVASLALLLLASCGGGRPEQPQRPRGSPPVTLTSEPDRATRQCFADLAGQSVRYSPLPDRDYGGGCLVTGAVQLLDFGVPTANLKAMRCPLARTFIAWTRNGIAPAAREILGSDLSRVETMGTYSCRNIIGGNSGRLSEHALANAVDVSAFILADGRRISIERDWNSSNPTVREFLRIIRASACKRFGTVLSPDYNAAHYNHLHLDHGRGPFCR